MAIGTLSCSFNIWAVPHYIPSWSACTRRTQAARVPPILHLSQSESGIAPEHSMSLSLLGWALSLYGIQTGSQSSPPSQPRDTGPGAEDWDSDRSRLHYWAGHLAFVILWGCSFPMSLCQFSVNNSSSNTCYVLSTEEELQMNW